MTIPRALHAAVLMLLPGTGAVAQPLLITFDDHAAMGNSPGAPIPEAARLSDFYLASHGVRFFSGSPFVAVVIHGANTPSGLQLIGGSTPDGRLTYQKSTPVEAAFFDPTGTIPFVVSAVSIRGDLQPISGTKTLEAYSVGGALLGADTQLDSSAVPLAVSAPGIHRIRVYSSSATVGFDDLRFDTPIAGMECPGDINGDSFVDDSDFSLFAVAYNILDCADPTMPPGCPADMNRDGYVDDIDFVIFLAQYNELLCP